MIDLIKTMFSYDFISRAIIVGILMSFCAAILGVSLVLKRYSMIGEGLSNVGFGALAVAMAFNLAPLQISIPVVTLTAFLLLRISENSKIKGDAAIALISSSSLTIGVIAISLTTGLNTDVCNYMFGSILSMNRQDTYISIGVTAVVLLVYVIFYNRIFAVTFDESFAIATGTKAKRYNTLIAILTALIVVVGMRMMGALLISSLIIFPSLTSMRVFRSFKGVIICSSIVSVICFFFGMVLSYVSNLPTGASVVATNMVAFVLLTLVGLILFRVVAKFKKIRE